MSEEWGPWIEHDGKGCPCVGQIVEIRLRSGRHLGPYAAGTRGPRGLSGNPKTDGWVHLPKRVDVLRYRIRKPRGMTILQGLLENLPEEVDA